MRSTLRALLPLTLIALGQAISPSAHANNIQVANATLVGNTGTYAFVQFDLSWENSWRGGGGVPNWDATWVFVKFKSLNGNWQHARLNNTGHTAPSGSQIDPGLLTPGAAFNATINPVLGVFVYRATDGMGSVSYPAIQLRWDYQTQGLAYSEISDIQVCALEMVFVPQGAFAAGSGGTETSAFTLTTINTANASTAPAGTGTLGGQMGGYPTGQTAPNAAWPNGFSSFYCMKYELSQQGYTDFLNTLSYPQQVSRAISTDAAPGTGALVLANTNRSGIDVKNPGSASTVPCVYACNLDGDALYGETTDGTDIACNHLGFQDQSAYLDWSGLRPMSELEFEKACRGILLPVANEYPWGTGGITASAYTLSNAGSTTEGIATNFSTTSGNASYDLTDGALNGPLRSGIFAGTSGSTGRVTAGASYYGIMELAGNLFERTVSLGTPLGRAYTGAHGNGLLAVNGDADVAGWPDGTSVSGAGVRGGAWSEPSGTLRISDRSYSTVPLSGPNPSGGCRGVRSAP